MHFKSGGSLIPVKRRIVIKRCKTTIAHVKLEQARRNRDYLQAEMERWNNGFWHKLFRRRPWTLEEVEAGIRKDIHERGLFSGYFMCFPSSYGEEDRETALKLLRVCESTDAAEVYLTAEDWDAIR